MKDISLSPPIKCQRFSLAITGRLHPILGVAIDFGQMVYGDKNVQKQLKANEKAQMDAKEPVSSAFQKVETIEQGN